MDVPLQQAFRSFLASGKGQGQARGTRDAYPLFGSAPPTLNPKRGRVLCFVVLVSGGFVLSGKSWRRRAREWDLASE